MDDGSIFSRMSPPDARQVKQAFGVGRFVILVVVVLAAFFSSIGPATEWLWYQHDVRQPQVIGVAYATRGTLFSVTFFIVWGFVWLNLRQALNVTLVYLRSPVGPDAAIANLVAWLQAQGSKVVRIAAPLLAFSVASGFSNEWNKLLLATHVQPFGVKDPTFGLDLSFFVFQLPWYSAVCAIVLSTTLLVTAVTVGVYAGLQALASLAKVELSRPAFRWHVSSLIGLAFVVAGVQAWLNSYMVGLAPGAQFTGAGHAAAQGYGALRVFGVLAIVTGIVAVVTVPRVRTYSIPIGGFVLLSVVYAAGVWGYPSLVQQFVVAPNRLTIESPFAAKAIRMTRYGYALDKIEARDFGARQNPTNAEVKEASTTLNDLRLWDPDILRQSLEGMQAFRPYYSFPDVDVDRYTIDGKQTMVMLSPRNIELEGLEAGARNWLNERLRYTHGYGLSMAKVGDSASNGQPSFLVSDVPIESKIPISQPRIYFSDFRNEFGLEEDEYAIVRTREPEFDYETGNGGNEAHRWESDRGIPVGAFLNRLLFAVGFGEPSFLFSSNLTGESRLLMHRNVLERAHLLYPFLRLDRDPYLVVEGGQLTWIVDGYTATDAVPYSEMVYGNAGLNYIRNSVKITVNAYTGETTAYAFDPGEPILRAYRAIYPNLIRDQKEFPADLLPHIRYPEDLLSVQSAQLARYHVTDPTVFLSNSDAWEIASERDLSGQTAPVRPYYVQLRLPDEPKEGFFQILPFSPRGRHTMSGWIAAHCDPQDYGKLILYRFTGGEMVDGPGLMEGNFSSTPEISAINRNYNNDQSEILVGNLLVVPLGRSVVYSETLFLKSRTQGIQAVPRLFRVILALNNDRIVVGTDLNDALAKLFQTNSPNSSETPAEPPTAPTGVAPDRVTRQAREALKALRDADAALRKGDFGAYGDLQKKARRLLEEAAR